MQAPAPINKYFLGVAAPVQMYIFQNWLVHACWPINIVYASMGELMF